MSAHFPVRHRRALSTVAIALVASVTLAACGSSGSSSKGHRSALTSGAASSRTTAAASATASTGTDPQGGAQRGSAQSSVTTSASSGQSAAGKAGTGSSSRAAAAKPAARTTIAATSATPAYTGPNPLYCLQFARLTDVRPGVESNVWEGNLSGTSPRQSNAIVFLAGPYANATDASQYAASLKTIPETATAAARWVASAAVTGHLDFQVKAVATCMAGTN